MTTEPSETREMLMRAEFEKFDASLAAVSAVLTKQWMIANRDTLVSFQVWYESKHGKRPMHPERRQYMLEGYHAALSTLPRMTEEAVGILELARYEVAVSVGKMGHGPLLTNRLERIDEAIAKLYQKEPL